MKKVLILVVAVLILVGGAVGVMAFLGLGPFAETPPAEGAEDAASGPATPAADLRPVPASAVVIPLLTDDGVAATYQIEFEYRVPDLDSERLVGKSEARLNDAFVSDLHGFLPRMLRDIGRLDRGILKKRMLMVAERALGAGVVPDIEIKTVIDRPSQ